MFRALSLALVAAVLLTSHCPGAAPSTNSSLPDAQEVIRHFIEHAAAADSNRVTGAWVFYRTNITEEFSRQGERTKHEELLLRVTVENGANKIELMEFNGREPTASEREQQLKRFGSRPESATSRDNPDRSRPMEAFITNDVLGRYVFTVRSRESIDGRPCIMVTFEPGKKLPDSGKLFERVLNQIDGVLWIDEAEYELVKADLQLRDRISLWGGFLGALDQMLLKILRTREPDGRWRDREVEARFVGRAFTRHVDVETHDYSSAPKPLSAVSAVVSQ